MPVGARRARHRLVGDVADHGVLELELRRPSDAANRAPPEEIASDERGEGVPDRRGSRPIGGAPGLPEALDQLLPGDRAGNRCILQRSLLDRRQAIEASCHQESQSCWHDFQGCPIGERPARPHPHEGAAFDQHSGALLEEQRIPGRAFYEPADDLLWQIAADRGAQDPRRFRSRQSAHSQKWQSAMAIFRLGPGERQEQHRVRPGRRIHFMEEGDQVRVGPMKVVEDDHDRSSPGDRPDEGTHCRARVDSRPARSVRGLLFAIIARLKAEQSEQVAFDGGATDVASRTVPQGRKGAADASGAPVAPDAELFRDRLGQRRQRQALAIGQAGTAHHERVGSPTGELFDQSRLADAGLVHHDPHPGQARSGHAVELHRQSSQDGRPIDERADSNLGRVGLLADRGPGANPLLEAHRLVHGDRLGFALHHSHLSPSVPNPAACKVPGRRPDEHVPGGRHVREAGADVDHVPDDGEARRFPGSADDHLTGVDPDVQPRKGRVVFDPETMPMANEGKAGPDGPLGIVLVGDRRSEDGHEPVAHDLRDGPPVFLDDQPEAGHPRPDRAEYLLRIHRRGECRVTRQVREQDRDDLPLGRDRRLAARRADQLPRGHDHTACAARQRVGSTDSRRRRRYSRPFAGGHRIRLPCVWLLIPRAWWLVGVVQDDGAVRPLHTFDPLQLLSQERFHLFERVGSKLEHHVPISEDEGRPVVARQFLDGGEHLARLTVTRADPDVSADLELPAPAGGCIRTDAQGDADARARIDLIADARDLAPKLHQSVVALRRLEERHGTEATG